MRNRFALATTCLLACAACVLPARSFGAYEEKASTTASDVLSAVETTRLAIRTAKEARGFSAYITTLVYEAEDDASSAQSTFGSIQPPDGQSQKLSDALDAIVGPAVKMISDVRIAARGGRMDDLPRAEPDLKHASDELNAFLDTYG